MGGAVGGGVATERYLIKRPPYHYLCGQCRLLDMLPSRIPALKIFVKCKPFSSKHQEKSMGSSFKFVGMKIDFLKMGTLPMMVSW